MRKINKNSPNILSKKYKDWVTDLEANNIKHPLSRTYYDDVVMNLYKCQEGVCAYTEKYICVEELYDSKNWVNDRYVIANLKNCKRTDHCGELEHFDPNQKKEKYWLWENFFMIDSTINSRKCNNDIVPYLKPDLEEYTPEKYFDYDEITHRFVPNTDIEDDNQKLEIQNMIDSVLFLNHGVILNERRNFINDVKLKIKNGFEYKIDRYYTSVNWCLTETI
ncbi:hypothetical protein GKZ90_0013610 [Flavobacterium sp. MC2016-06]|jgi:hypothetical protein|uniref:hypothetical protein n=1 Tax=Flavobacterium sp. MC2016-06 TaxID=2676308 RepID=UPI0012BA5C84|nr:hypothetical protein [Flavobacterium sp. MC2016-06]MBU3859877.1 hypothetical protein [Flavobacterium sp. MC2016-06]